MGKARLMQRGPEAIARPREVMTDRGRVKAGIYPAKKHPEPRRNYVGDGLARGFNELLPGWPEGPQTFGLGKLADHDESPID